MICENDSCKRDVTRLSAKSGDTRLLCGDCYDAPEPWLVSDLHLSAGNKWAPTLTAAKARDIMSRRLAEDGRTVVRDPKGKMPKKMVWG